MTELVPFETQDRAISQLVEWAEGAKAAHGIAQSLAQTPFVPQSMQGKPGLVTAAILAGFELGLQPISALRSIDIIQGVPAMRAHTLRGLVQSRGHDVWVEESNSTRAVVCGRRKGSEQVQKSVWTMDRAKGLKLDGKDNWRKQPQAMLVARATSEVCRLVGSDVILGLPYAAEELDDDGAPDVDKPASKAKRRTAQRKPVEKPDIPEPELDEPDEPVTEAPADQPSIPEPELDES